MKLYGACWLESGSQSEIKKIREDGMNWEQVEGKWKQYTGKVKEKWGKLTDDDIQQIAGKRDQLVGKIQERYGIKKEAAMQQIDEFSRSLGTSEPMSKTHGSGRG
jgi:uncharacterized protein YjbJ (UPF0337 family)